VKKQNFFFKGKHLADDRLVSDYGIDKGSMLELVSVSPDIQVYVMDQEGDKIPIMVNKDESIASFKHKIQESEGCND
jgi:hypothetical protein